MTEAELAASLCCARLAPPTAALVAVVRPVLAAALEASVRLPPLGLVADLSIMVVDPSLAMVDVHVPGLVLRHYDDRVVGPLVTDRRRLALADAYAALDSRYQPLAIALVAESLADDLDPEGPWWEAGPVRAWLGRTDEEIWALALESLTDDPAPLRARIEALARRVARGFTASHVHLVQHLPALASRAQRVAVEQVLEAATAFDLELPRAVRPRSRTGFVVSDTDDEARYPAGGFAALTTSGSPENLVASELVYMEEGTGIDLFAVRYAEGELLYYTRDEAVYTRQRRTIHVALGPDLADARVKDPELPTQRLVLVLAMVRAVVERVIRWLGPVELRIVVHVLDPRLEAERRLTELVLRSWVETGVVQVVASDPEDFAAAIAESAQRVETDVAWLSTGSPPPDDLAVEPWVFEVASMPWRGWVRAATELAHHLA